MLVAHLPAGYLVGIVFRRCRPAAPGTVAAAMIGGMAPDIDMAWFLVTGGHRHHHDYVTHWPLFWLACAIVTLPAVRLMAARWIPAASAFFVSAMLHMVLDTIAAPIMWLAPFSDRATELIVVPATRSHWVLSFVTHWTFLLELAICGVAIALALARRGSEKAGAAS